MRSRQVQTLVYHGIQAFTGKDAGIHDLIARSKTAISGVEVCGATRPIGEIGLVLHGMTRAVYDNDCWSYTDHLGERISDSHQGDLRVIDGGVTQSDIALMGKQAEAKGKRYAETHTRADAISCVWVKRSANATIKKQARVLARHFGRYLLEVDHSSRIWQYI